MYKMIQLKKRLIFNNNARINIEKKKLFFQNIFMLKVI